MSFIGYMGGDSDDKPQVIHPLHLLALFPILVADLAWVFIEGEASRDKRGRIMYLPSRSASFFVLALTRLTTKTSSASRVNHPPALKNQTHSFPTSSSLDILPEAQDSSNKCSTLPLSLMARAIQPFPLTIPVLCSMSKKFRFKKRYLNLGNFNS